MVLIKIIMNWIEKSNIYYYHVIKKRNVWSRKGFEHFFFYFSRYLYDRDNIFKKIQNKSNIDINDVIVEYVDKILCVNGKVYTNLLILCNNDYSILLRMHFEIMSKNLLNHI